MKSDETAKTDKDEEHSRQKRSNSLSSFVNFFFVLALATSISMLLGFYSKEEIWTGLEEITIYMAIGGGLLLAYMITRKLRQRSRMSHESMMSNEATNTEKRPSQRRKNSLLSHILSFCLPGALTLFLLGILSGHSFSDIIDTFSLPEITVYVAVGGGILLAHILTRKPRKRTSKNSPEQESQEEL